MSYSEEQRAAGAFAARTPRACDSCLRRRALWFCNADDAFLCQACDASVHSANPFTRRHHRVRLNSASSSSRSCSPSSFVPTETDDFSDEHATPAWLHGLTRKPRTPRGKPGAIAAVALAASKVESLVPDLEDLFAEENQPREQEEKLLYCVPILDPAVLSEFCTQPHQIDAADSSCHEVKPAVELQEYDHVPAVAGDGLAGFRPRADLDLEEFASDMEKLLGRGLDDDDAFCIDGLSLVNEGLMEDDKGQVKLDTARSDVACNLRTEIKEDEHKPLQEAAATRRRATILKLDYEAVITAWSSTGCSPWTGERPQLDPKDDIWTDFAAIGGGGKVRELYQQVAMAAAAVGKGREARVSRYRKKRRTRLFSKKIRYEVRKLNAEKRPRMKGRFVKTAAAAASEFPAAAIASTLPYL